MNLGNQTDPEPKKQPDPGREPEAPESELRDDDNKTRMVDDKLMGDDRMLKDINQEPANRESDTAPDNNY